MQKRILLEATNAGRPDLEEVLKTCSVNNLVLLYKDALNRGISRAQARIELELYDRGYTFHIAPLTTILRPRPDMFMDELVYLVIKAKGDVDPIFERAEQVQVPAAIVLICYTIAIALGEDKLAQKLAAFIKHCGTYNNLVKGYLQLCWTDSDIYKRLAQITVLAQRYKNE